MQPLNCLRVDAADLAAGCGDQQQQAAIIAEAPATPGRTRLQAGQQAQQQAAAVVAAVEAPAGPGRTRRHAGQQVQQQAAAVVVAAEAPAAPGKARHQAGQLEPARGLTCPTLKLGFSRSCRTS